MSNDVHAELFASPSRLARRRPAGERRVINVTVQADERLLLTVAEAAAHLGLRPQTVASYVKVIYQKLNITSRAVATREAIRRALS